jgi:hypothetical protein
MARWVSSMLCLVEGADDRCGNLDRHHFPDASGRAVLGAAGGG